MKLRVYNKTLDPSMWDDKTLKPEVKESLLKIAASLIALLTAVVTNSSFHKSIKSFFKFHISNA